MEYESLKGVFPYTPGLKYFSCLCLLLGMHIGLVVHVARSTSPVSDELGHFAAGMSHWELGRFDLFAVNPPFPRMLATLPAHTKGLKLSWEKYSQKLSRRAEFMLGRQFVSDNPNDFRDYFITARYTLIPLSILGMLVSSQWARQLYGNVSAATVAVLWCFSPTFITYGSMITPDLAAASLSVSCCYLFRRWTIHPHWGNAICCGTLIGLSLLAKFTMFILYPTLGVLTLVHWPLITHRAQSRLRCVVCVVVMFITSLYVLNLGYGFSGSMQTLGGFSFRSDILTGEEADNRFRGSFLGDLPVPLPAQALLGIDYVKWEFERGYSSYLRGERKHGGWWYYYLYALLVKVPLGTLLLVVFACCDLMKQIRNELCEQLLLLLPPLVIIFFVSSQTGFNHHFRYVLPAFPFLFIHASRVGHIAWTRSAKWRLAHSLTLLQIITSCMVVYPHTLSYFNEAAGGPRSGWRHLDFSSIDWGQDMYYFQDWYKANIGSRPLYCSTKSHLPWDALGIKATKPMVIKSASFVGRSEFPPGWYALGFHQMLRPESNLGVFLELTPNARIGFSMNIYHLEKSLTITE